MNDSERLVEKSLRVNNFALFYKGFDSWGNDVDWIEGAIDRAVYKVNLSGGQRRLKEAILHVCKLSEPMKYFGAIKLNKILWRADFRAYRDRKIPVTGRQYQRLRLGPAPVEIPPIINEMLREGLLKKEPRQHGNHTEIRHIALVGPVLNLFSQEDLDYIDEAVSHYWAMTGSETSDQSHGVAWKTRENGDPMPYQSAFLEDETLPPAALDHFVKMAKEKNWRSS